MTRHLFIQAGSYILYYIWYVSFIYFYGYSVFSIIIYSLRISLVFRGVLRRQRRRCSRFSSHTCQTRTPAPHQRNSITHPIASTCIAYMLARMYESKYEYKNVFRVCARTVCARVCARADTIILLYYALRYTPTTHIIL